MKFLIMSLTGVWFISSMSEYCCWLWKIYLRPLEFYLKIRKNKFRGVQREDYIFLCNQQHQFQNCDPTKDFSCDSYIHCEMWPVFSRDTITKLLNSYSK